MDVAALRDAVAGPVLTPDDPGYADAVTKTWGPPMAPDVYVRPHGTGDIATTLAWARDGAVDVAIHSGGHGAWSAQPGGVVLDLADFSDVSVDGDLAHVGAGNTLGDVATKLAAHGLAVSGGDTASVGVGGNTLGAGVGWMPRSVGLAVDQLVGAEVVAVDGRVVHASASENPDLFWALRGGGGNFGVVTRFDFRATPLTSVVFGTSTIDTSKLAGIIRGVRDAMRSAPRPLGIRLVCPPPGPGSPPPMILAFWARDDLAAAQAAVAPLAEVDGVGAFALSVVPYTATVNDPQSPPGPPPRFTGASGVFAPLPDETADRAAAALAQHPMTMFEVRFLGGAFGDVAPDATPLAWRDAEALLHWIVMVPNGSSDEDLAAAMAVWQPVGEGRAAVVSTFVESTSDALLPEMYPPAVIARLRAIKAEWDPTNLLHRNHDIAPA